MEDTDDAFPMLLALVLALVLVFAPERMTIGIFFLLAGFFVFLADDEAETGIFSFGFDFAFVALPFLALTMVLGVCDV